MTPRMCLAIALLLPTGLASAQGPRPDEARELRRKVEASLVGELTGRWYPDRSRSMEWERLPPDVRPGLVRPARRQPLPGLPARMTWTAATFARHSPAHRDEFTGYARKGSNISTA